MPAQGFKLAILGLDSISKLCKPAAGRTWDLRTVNLGVPLLLVMPVSVSMHVLITAKMFPGS